MKKYLLFAILIFIMFALTACGSKDYDYYVTDAGVTITKYTGDASDIEVPSKIKGKPVTSIGDFAFADCVNLTNVMIPQSVTSIGRGVFYNCNNLSITIPERTKYQSSEAFENCNYNNLIKYNAVNEEAILLRYFTGSDTKVEIPSMIGKYQVTSIGERCFSNSDMTSVSIPNSVKSIGKSAFYECANLCSITIPNNVTSIEESTFLGCSSLTSVTIPYGVKSIGSHAFQDCSKLTSVTIPNSVESIGSSAFQSCHNLTNLKIPVGVKNIGGYAFYNCFELKNVTIPNSVSWIGGSAFEGTGLTTVTISNSVKSIAWGMFKNCFALTNVTIPDGVTDIHNEAFANCIFLSTITIPDSVTDIGNQVFENCSNLVIMGSAGSKAQDYAQRAKITFEEIR